jgi:ABC-type transport system involved in multi-copper enzyme maturation permease subunit
MTVDLRNTVVIAQKEFADHLYSPSFRILLFNSQPYS